MTTDYLTNQFQRRPLLDADPIVDARCDFVGMTSAADEPAVVERWDIMAAVEDLHTAFWSMDASAFAAAAAAVNTTSYPTYVAEIERLLGVNACRDDYAELEGRCQDDDERRFVAMLRRIAVANRHAGIVIREQLIYTLSVKDAVETLPGEWHTDADPARQTAICDACRRVAGMVKSDFPRLYKANPEWFDRNLTPEL